MAATADLNQDEVEPFASEVLKLLGSCRREDVQVVVALATTGLQRLKDARGSKPALETIQSSAAAVLRFTLSDLQENNSSANSFTLDNATSALFWCSCYSLSAEVTDLLPSITALRALSERCTHLTLLFLRVASSVLTHKETVQFLQHLCKRFWRQEISQLAKRLEVNEGSGSFSDLNQGWLRCIKSLVFLYVIQSIYDSLCSSVANMYLSTQSEGKEDITVAVRPWLCSDILSPVLNNLVLSVPLLVYSAHQQWLKDDRDKLGRSKNIDLPVRCLKTGQVFKSCALLTDALNVLATVAAGSLDKSLQINFTATILSLGHHYWEQLAQIVKEVPRGLPMKVWYLVISSSLHLHSHLSTFHPTLETNSSEKQHFPQLLQTLSEFCDGLRENIVSYHSELLIASLLHDSNSHDWQNSKPFFEGERCSFSVQMWHYYLRGLKHDLWTICPGPLATSILASVLARTVSHLASRYTAVRPSHRRVAQFRADILAILVSSASLLPCISPPSTPLTVSTEVTTVHRSCAVLLASLVVVGCQLEQLQASLTQLNEGVSDDLNIGQLWQWMEYLSLDHFGTVRYGSTAGPALSDFTVLVSLPYPKWELLLKLLLARDGMLATTLACSLTSKGDSLLPHVALIVAHCYHQPRALSNLFTALGNNCIIAPGNIQLELKPCLKWLADLLKDELQRCVMSGATEFCSSLKQQSTMHQASPDVTECLVAVVGRLESCLYQLPQPVVNVLCDLAGGGMNPTATQTPDFSIRLSKVLCVLMASWLGPSFPSSSSSLDCRPLLSLMATYCTVLKHVLQGTITEGGHHLELASLSPELLRLLRQQSPVLQDRVRRFASSLHWTPPSEEGPSICTDVEHEVVAEMLAADSRVLRSLELLYSTLKANKTTITQALCTPSSPSLPVALVEDPHGSDFNPLTACTSLGGETFNHQKLLDTKLDWRVLLDDFALRVLGRRTTAIVVGNRPEFQEGAQLQGREPEFVEAIRASLT